MSTQASSVLQATQLVMAWPTNASEHIMALFARVLNCTHAALFLHHGTSGLRFNAAIGWSVSDLASEVPWPVDPMLRSQHLSTVTPVPSENWSSTERAFMAGAGLQTLFCCPLSLPDSTYGVLYAADAEAFTPTHAQSMEALEIAQLLTLGLHHQLQLTGERRDEQRQHFLENSPDLILSLSGSRILTISASCERLLGYTPQEMVNTDFLTCVHPDNLAQTLDSLERLQRNGASLLFENRHVHKEGRTVHVEWNATMGHGEVLALGRDVTSRQPRVEFSRLLGAAVEQATDLIYIADEHWAWPGPYFKYVNEAFARHFGYSREELIGQPTHIMRGPLTDTASLSEMRRAVQEELLPYRGEMIAHRKNGEPFWTEYTVAPVDHPAGQFRHIVVNMRDVTERIQANEARAAALRQATALTALTVTLEEIRELPDVLQVALEHSLNVLPFQEVLFWPLQLEHPRLLNTLISPPPKAASPHLIEQLKKPEFRRLLHQGLVVVQPGAASFLLPHREHGLDAHQELVLPILVEEQLYGVMVFRANHLLTVPTAIQQLMGAIRDRIAHAIERTLHLHQLADSREETLKTLGMVLEYRDYETKGHTDRVMTLAQNLGQQMGLSAGDLDALKWGAYLHDTGKVAIPDQILLKPGRLTPEEFQVIQQHSQLGFDLLRHIPTLPEASLQVVLHHHEKWDGSGYPHALSGEAIPLLARIFTVVDVYDALVSRRPYKEPMTHREAMQEIVRCSGGMFDPVVVAVFERFLETSASSSPAIDLTLPL